MPNVRSAFHGKLNQTLRCQQVGSEWQEGVHTIASLPFLISFSLFVSNVCTCKAPE